VLPVAADAVSVQLGDHRSPSWRRDSDGVYDGEDELFYEGDPRGT
jgi:hypothetical protein